MPSPLGGVFSEVPRKQLSMQLLVTFTYSRHAGKTWTPVLGILSEDPETPFFVHMIGHEPARILVFVLGYMDLMGTAIGKQ